jgi:hypothetical protein
MDPTPEIVKNLLQDKRCESFSKEDKCRKISKREFNTCKNWEKDPTEEYRKNIEKYIKQVATMTGHPNNQMIQNKIITDLLKTYMDSMVETKAHIEEKKNESNNGN